MPTHALLRDPVVDRLLSSDLLAHVGYTWTDGTPRCVPVWFLWDGKTVNFVGSSNGARQHALHDGDHVAVSIDDPVSPYQGVQLRGTVAVTSVGNPIENYRRMAHRYLGRAAGDEWCGRLVDRDSLVTYRVRPIFVGVLDLDEQWRTPRNFLIRSKEDQQ